MITEAMACMAQRVIVLAVSAALPALCAAAEGGPYRVCIDLASDIQLLASDDLFESGPASDRLVALGAPALPALDAALQREPPAVRIAVVGVLREMASADVVPLLMRSAADTDDGVRREAILGLGTLEAAPGTPLVEAALSDPSPAVRRAALVACGALCQSPAALTALVTAATEGDDMAAFQTAARVIREARGERAAVMRGTIEARAVPLAGQASAPALVRLRAAALLAVAGDARAVPVIRSLSLAPQAPPFRFHAILALPGVPTPDTVAALRELARDAALRPAACNALGALAAQQVDGAAAAQKGCPSAPAPAQSRVWRPPDHLGMVGAQRGGPG
ncbi:MAG: HEAT repeat domain-containing protein [Candidatus Binatia bacterium]